MPEFSAIRDNTESVVIKKSGDNLQSEASQLLSNSTAHQPDRTEQNNSLVREGTLPDVNIDFGNSGDTRPITQPRPDGPPLKPLLLDDQAVSRELDR